jgi:DNA-binding NarL/FixJ family response regulator
MIEILIADDHAIVREGLKQIVGEEVDMQVTGEAGDVQGLFALLNTREFSILILDISMPGRSGLDALHDIRSNYPKLPVLILSMYNEDQYGIRAIKAGAAGYLIKYSAPAELVKAIRKIVHGGKYISEALAEKLAWTIQHNGVQLPHLALSDREYEVFRGISSGLSAESIADKMSISINTFYTYRNRVLEKMNMRTNVELTQYAMKNGLSE